MVPGLHLLKVKELHLRGSPELHLLRVQGLI